MEKSGKGKVDRPGLESQKTCQILISGSAVEYKTKYSKRFVSNYKVICFVANIVNAAFKVVCLMVLQYIACNLCVVIAV